MGACIGKKTSKHRKRYQSQSDIIQAPQPKTQDDDSGKKPSPSSSKKLPVVDNLTVNNADDLRLSQLDEISIDSEIRIIVDEQKMILEALIQPLPSRVISITDSELECELQNLMVEHTENGAIINLPVTPIFKSSDAK